MTIRQCFPCKACCEGWLTAKIGEAEIFPGKPCINLTERGCGIYDDRPEVPCRSFKCGWLNDPVMIPEHMKPESCGAIVLLDRKWHGRNVIRAVPTGEQIPAATLEWLMAFSREQSLPLLFVEYLMRDEKFIGIKKKGYGPPSFIRAVETEVEPEDIIKF